jgi:predicted enzyme related to lactoylglutathione lyase
VDASHGRFVGYELTTTDAAAARTFYGKVMEWGTRDVSMPGMPYALFTSGEAVVGGLLALTEESRKIGATPRWLGYVGVTDVDAAAEQVRRLGGAVHIPPTEVPGISRLSVVSDPQMATFVLSKRLDRPQELLGYVGSPGSVGWHELISSDPDKAFAFYRDLFGWEKGEAAVDPMNTYQWFSLGGQTIGGMFTKSPTVPVAFWLYYFNVGDVDATARRVKTAGGRILEGPIELPGGIRIAQCTDPQGAMFALTGKRSDRAIGYFEPAAADGPTAARFFVPRRSR